MSWILRSFYEVRNKNVTRWSEKQIRHPPYVFILCTWCRGHTHARTHGMTALSQWLRPPPSHYVTRTTNSYTTRTAVWNSPTSALMFRNSSLKRLRIITLPAVSQMW